jgi:hypothetical protein
MPVRRAPVFGAPPVGIVQPLEDDRTTDRVVDRERSFEHHDDRVRTQRSRLARAHPIADGELAGEQRAEVLADAARLRGKERARGFADGRLLRKGESPAIVSPLLSVPL